MLWTLCCKENSIIVIEHAFKHMTPMWRAVSRTSLVNGATMVLQSNNNWGFWTAFIKCQCSVSLQLPSHIYAHSVYNSTSLFWHHEQHHSHHILWQPASCLSWNYQCNDLITAWRHFAPDAILLLTSRKHATLRSMQFLLECHLLLIWRVTLSELWLE